MVVKIKLTKGQISSIKDGNNELFVTAEQVETIYKKALQIEEEKYNS